MLILKALGLAYIHSIYNILRLNLFGGIFRVFDIA